MPRMCRLSSFFVAFLLALTVVPVDGYQAEVRQTLLAKDETSVPVHYRFEWEIFDSVRYQNSLADKAELQDRARDTL